jgi:hypothetical protein
MNNKDAIIILEQAINAASLKGIYGLEDMRLIILALEKIKEIPAN